MARTMRRTKIVCTIGPAVHGFDMLKRLAEAGMDAARLNFSHGSHAEFSRIIRDLRHIEKMLDRPLGILADIQGPKLRVGKLDAGEIELKVGEEVWMTADPTPGGLRSGKIVIPTAYKDFVKEVHVAHTILLDDGLLALTVIEKLPHALRCGVINGGILRENKGINVPGANFSAQAITEKDYEDILFCLEHGVDFIALSFVRSAQEIRHLKRFVESRSKRTQVLAKIEKREALAHLEEIIDSSDGILIARGDLAVEMGNERVPVIQKKIIRQCNLRAKTVIIATQMLMSMVENPRPTRAEASDVANSIVEGTDALMLSNETAVGMYPVESLKMMDKIICEMEEATPVEPILFNEWILPPPHQTAIAILQSSVRLSAIVKAKLIVVVTQSGQSVLLVSKCRPKNRVIAITGSLETYHQGALKWGTETLFMEDMENLITQTSVFEAIGQRLLALQLCASSDKIVITAGLPRLVHGSTNTIKVHQI